MCVCERVWGEREIGRARSEGVRVIRVSTTAVLTCRRGDGTVKRNAIKEDAMSGPGGGFVRKEEKMRARMR